MCDYPSLPMHIGRKQKIRTQDGNEEKYTVKDELIEMANKEKAVYLQELEFADGNKEYRLAYWRIGIKGDGTRGWVFGQFAPMVTDEVFEKILEKAMAKGWFAC